MPDVPEPTSFGLTKDFHVDARDICIAVSNALNLDSVIKMDPSSQRMQHDVPGHWFKGPF
jgi:pyruvate dehydrogenase E1 component beta subunit